MSNIQNITESDVKKYYDKNTKWFLRLGQHKKISHIHQAVWGEGATSLEEALHYTPNLILKELSENLSKPIHLLDLGCGVGGTMQYICHQTSQNVQLTGITISSQQQQMAAASFKKLKLTNRCAVMEGSFQQLPSNLKKHDLAYAIEAFVHSPNALQFFEQVSNALKPKGKLILVDDFLSSDSKYDDEAQKQINDFMKGWHLGSVLHPSTLSSLAQQHGLAITKSLDLTPNLNLQRPRDRFIRLYTKVMSTFLQSSTYFQSLVGGNARYQCLKQGWLEYRMLVFEKT